MAKYVVYGWYEDEADEEFILKKFDNEADAHDFAYDYEAQHDGIIRTEVRIIKGSVPAKRPAVKKVVNTVKKTVKKPVKKQMPNGFALMYLAHPEDVEMGADENRWFTFKNNGQTVTHFATLEGLLRAIMTQLKPSGKWKYAHIYKCSGGKAYKYAEITIALDDWELKNYVFGNGSKLANKSTVIAVDTKPGSWDWFIVSNSGKTTPIYWKSSWEEKHKAEAKPKVVVKEHKAETKPRRKSPFEEIDEAFSKGKSMIRFS